MEGLNPQELQKVQEEYSFDMQEKSLKRIEIYIDTKCRTKRNGVLEKGEASELFIRAAQLD